MIIATEKTGPEMRSMITNRCRQSGGIISVNKAKAVMSPACITIYTAIKTKSTAACTSPVRAMFYDVWRHSVLRQQVLYIDDLTSAQKEVLILRYWKCLTIKQIAAIIGVSDDSVKDRLNGAKNALKKKMKVF